MASKAAALGDPRRPTEIKKYVRAHLPDDDAPTPLMLLGLMLAMGSMLLKMKLLSWAAIFIAMASVVHLESENPDYKQVVMTVTFAGMGLISSYFPNPARSRQAAATG